MGLFDKFKKKPAAESGSLMTVEDVFSIKNVGIVLAGKVQQGIAVGDKVSVNNKTYKVMRIDAPPQQVKIAAAGMNVGLLLNTMNAQDFKHGDVVYKGVVVGNTVSNNATTVNNAQVSDDYIQALKKVAIKYMPNNMTADHLEVIFDMVGAILPAEPIKLMLDVDTWAKAKREANSENASEALSEAFAETAFRLNKYMDALNASAYERAVKTANEEVLLKAFIATDFYAYHLKDEYTVNLRGLQKIIAREMLNRGFTNIVSKEVSPFEALQAKCNEAVKTAPDADETKAMVVELGKMMLSLEKFYVLIDKDFNDQFPFIGTDGRIEVCSSLEIAQAVGNYYHEQKLGHVAIREYTGVADALKSFQKMGIAVVRLDNGVKPVDIWLKDILEPVSSNVIEADNIGAKGMFLRELQYGYRLSKADNTQGEWAFKKGTTEFMLTMRYNAYRDFANGLCYVLVASCPYVEGKTFYTEKALEKAKELLQKHNLPEASLIADGDTEYAVHTGPVNIRVSQKPGEQDMATSFACAFTGREEIETVRKNFMNYGINDGVLVITFDELYSHAMQCAGILVDMPTYGLELKKEEFPEVLKWKIFPGGIIVNINDKKE